ncbi:hypothetical protein RHECNPAF_1330042 [Rhizobium etli CNPAF512]|nr:hypothetical protein RHECNPAF_1330042 [Rhizobium etli CNPAF512]
MSRSSAKEAVTRAPLSASAPFRMALQSKWTPISRSQTDDETSSQETPNRRRRTRLWDMISISPWYGTHGPSFWMAHSRLSITQLSQVFWRSFWASL